MSPNGEAPVFSIEFAELAASKFRKLPPTVKNRIAGKLREVARDPRRHLRRLSGVDAFRVRVGDYRVILDVDWDSRTLHVLTLGHRSNVYR